MSDSVRPSRWQPARLPRPWDSPGKNTGVGCISFSRGSSRPRDGTWVSCTASGFFTTEPPGKSPYCFLSQPGHLIYPRFLVPCDLFQRKNPFYPVSVELHYMVLTRISGKANNKACMSNSQKQSIQEKCPTTSQMSEHTIRVF